MRRDGGSIADVTFASPLAARMVTGWRVVGTETLSDYRYIRMDVSDPSLRDGPVGRPNNGAATPRLVLRRLDRDALLAAATAMSWEGNVIPPGQDEAIAGAAWFREAMTQICNTSMPRAGPPPAT